MGYAGKLLPQQQSSGQQPDVTVIVPAYNAEARISACIESVCAHQDLDLDIELLVIDDGSTDRTPEILAELAATYACLRVTRQKNSGWPGTPRNAGLEVARGRYVFFLDADDTLTQNSLAALVAFADEHACDIVLPKIRAVNRRIHTDVFESTEIDADVRKLLRSNFVFKLFRTDFLHDHGLRFAEEKIRLEDAIFCFSAYVRSKRTAILADRDYYMLMLHDDGVHISLSAIDSWNHSEGVSRAMAPLTSGPWPADELAEAKSDFFRRVVLVRYGTGFANRSVDRQLQWMQANIPLAQNHISTALARDQYGPVNRARLWGLQHADKQALLAVSKRAENRRPLVFASTDALSSDSSRLHISGTVTPAWGVTAIASIRLEARTSEGVVIASGEAALTRGGADPLLETQTVTFSSALRHRSLLGAGKAKLYAVVTATDGTVVGARLGVGAAQLPKASYIPVAVTWSTTRFDGVSVSVRIAGIGRLRRVVQPAVAGLGRLLSGIRASRLGAGMRSGVRSAVEALRSSGTRDAECQQPEVALPVGQYFGLTWNIPVDFGGMTRVLLHRAAMFTRQAAVPVDILTLSPDLDLEGRTAQLRSHGLLPDGVRLRNLWDELRTASDRDLARLPGGRIATVASPADGGSGTGRSETGRLGDDDLTGVEKYLRTEYRRAGKDLVRIEHRRPDGTLLLIDRRLGPGRRQLTLCGRSGQPLREWTSAKQLHFAWLDSVIGTEQTFLISDSKAIGKYLHHYRRDHIVVTQVLHSTHLDAHAASVYGPATGYHYDILRSISDFDLVTVLTESQQAAVEMMLGSCSSLSAIPNALSAPPMVTDEPRECAAGVIVGRLHADKRVDHALQALAEPVLTSGVSLTVIGSGPERERLEKMTGELCLHDQVVFTGYSDEVARAFARASFSLLCSQYEGMSLVLVESMAAGCIPIAYDIRYGPADIITDGVDGFLIADGDIAGLAAAIAKIQSMPDAELEQMREAARRRSADFNDRAITRRWAEELTAARERKIAGRPTPHSVPTPDVTEVLLDRAGGLSIIGTLAHTPASTAAGPLLQVMARKVPILFRMPVELGTSEKGETIFRAQVPVAGLLETFPAATLDIYLQPAEVRSGAGTRVPAPDGFSAIQCGRLRAYATKKGNLSVEISAG